VRWPATTYRVALISLRSGSSSLDDEKLGGLGGDLLGRSLGIRVAINSLRNGGCSLVDNRLGGDILSRLGVAVSAVCAAAAAAPWHGH
jgi:hypothetical protein